MKISSTSAFLISILLFLSFSFQLYAQNPTCNPQDQIAINQIQKSFGVPLTPNCCDWDAVTCDNAAPFRVLNLLITNSNISGQIPAAIGDLPSLGIFELINVPKITGNIPPAITKLTNLVTLVVSKAGLTGTIPTFLVNLKNLTFLDLSFNGLTGTIPPQLSQFPNFQVLHLDNNKLTGPIPESFGQFSNTFEFLTLSHNLLTGTVPQSLSNLNLLTIDLSFNNFNGDASLFFSKNKITQDVFLQNNNFKFDLTNVVFPTNLKRLNLSHNSIFGSLPQQLTQITFSKLSFDVSYNMLCGAIPQGGILQTVGVNAYVHNKCLCGAPLAPCS